MCTITYLPISTAGFILTQNRDESPLRSPAVFPVKERRNQTELLFPQDPQGGGSWIATDCRKRLFCLMNGGIGHHQPKPPYRQSRGQILLDAASGSFSAFAEDYSLEGIEPFTLLCFERKEHNLAIYELKWNGKLKYTRTHDPARPHIWSAPQLYSPPQQQERESWFLQWLETNPSRTPEAILDFHFRGRHGSGGKEQPEHSLLLRREQVKTVSITQVQANDKGMEMRHIPLQTDP
ncbi:NRDE family protein [Nafulsella turpanensis]|uniref:NRDE family protein n=1 Tax=Nafulsella turpanensis TaxID=1265690 RepID=UPI00034D49E4|nr:NRDE family protein [Nafulsella turpanensis]